MTFLRRLGGVVAVVVTVAVAAGAFLALSGARVSVGPPLPRIVRSDLIPRPILPKTTVFGPQTKPGALDLVGLPVAVTIAPSADPLVTALVPRLTMAVAEAGDAGTSSILVIDADGRVVFDVNGAAPLIPASTAKLVTAAGALAAFGPDFRFTTRLVTTAPIGPDGVVDGDLVLVGGGDPTLVSPAYVEGMVNPERPQTPLAGLADAAVAAGITAVTGQVIGDPGYLLGPSLAQGWPPRYLEDRDATHIAGLTVDQGLQLFSENGRLRSRAAPDPAAEAAAALTTALTERDIVVTGPPVSADVPDDVVVEQVGELRSPPMMTLLTRVVQNSDNHLADTIFRAVGRRVEGDGSFAAAEVQTLRLLEELQLETTGIALRDGSGLSRESRLTAGFLTILNLRMTQSSVGPRWQELMAVAGQSGTLRRRLPDTIAELRLRGKTGSLGDVRALSGAVVGPDGRPLYFTVTSNDLEGAQLAAARRLQDLVVLELSASLYGCVRVPVPEPVEPPPPGPEPLPTYTCTG